MDAKNHHKFMRQALNLAKKGKYSVAPNPMVGCVIVKDNQVIATGYHKKPGCNHAEIEALNQAGSQAIGASLYVNLEPCCHYGRTPPCVNAIISSGIKKVYIAQIDPNPKVQSKGIKALRDANIQVETGILRAEAKKLNRFFNHYISTKMPYIIAKWAMSLDGKTIINSGDSPQISNKKTNKITHQIRKQVDAIIIGANTAMTDNPQLTARTHNNKKHPLRILLSSKGELSLDLAVFDKNLPGKTLVVTTSLAKADKLQEFQDNNIEVIITKPNQEQQVDIYEMLKILGNMNICSILVEGGMKIHNSFIKANLVNEFMVYIAPCIIGNHRQKVILPCISSKKIDSNYLMLSRLTETENV